MHLTRGYTNYGQDIGISVKDFSTGVMLLQVGLIGVGRMGKELARRLKGYVELTVYDFDPNLLDSVANELSLTTADNIEDIAKLGTVILAVPDSEVINCIKDFNQQRLPLTVVNIATNVDQHVLEETADRHIRCIGVKFVGQASEMAAGGDPVIIINDRPAELTAQVADIFVAAGQVLVGKADVAGLVNTIAAEKALEAVVNIEDVLQQQGVTNPAIIRSAIRQVAAGIMKAYADQELGPFARQIVSAVRSRRGK
jgi:3-hydroxyisobutyrate dehydrogenase-like beta-hydroxyacid dehydrogenase